MRKCKYRGCERPLEGAYMWCGPHYLEWRNAVNAWQMQPAKKRGTSKPVPRSTHHA